MLHFAGRAADIDEDLGTMMIRKREQEPAPPERHMVLTALKPDEFAALADKLYAQGWELTKTPEPVVCTVGAIA